MKIVRTFAIEGSNSSLFSVKIDKGDDPDYTFPWESNAEIHELYSLFEFWNDPSRLRIFFEENEADLNEEFWEGISIEDAIIKTRNEFLQLSNLLFESAIVGKQNEDKNLSTIFKPLSEGVYERTLEKDKLRLKKPKTWLRLYAIRLDVNLFVICGGAIKLRKTLNDRNYLKQELLKLNCTKEYLNSNSDILYELIP